MIDLKRSAENLGAKKVESRIRWIWAFGFPDMEAAEKFVTILESHNLLKDNDEIRGPHDFKDESRGIAVGWYGG